MSFTIVITQASIKKRLPDKRWQSMFMLFGLHFGLVML